MSDPVNHPAHYTQVPGVECIDVIEGLGLNFHLGLVMKYLWRHAQKGGLEDLKKAQWYLSREITRLETPSWEDAESEARLQGIAQEHAAALEELAEGFPPEALAQHDIVTELNKKQKQYLPAHRRAATLKKGVKG